MPPIHPDSAPTTVVVGANHRSSSSALRDLLFMDDAMVPGFLASLRRRGIAQAILLCTCDRTEIQAMCGPAQEAELALALAEFAGQETEGQLYSLRGAEAVRHVFAVAASLDSQVIGEPQILGQVKAAHRLAREAGMMGPELEALTQAALAAAKRVRNETAIGERPVSIAAAAVMLARDVHGGLDRAAGLLLGTGEMGEMVAVQLLAQGLGRLVVAGPLESRAEAVARRLDCHVGSFADCDRLLVEADVVIAAVGARRPCVTAEALQSALKRRRYRPMLLIDCAIPGDVEPAVDRLGEAFLYDLGDLERVAQEGRATREAASKAAWEIVAAESAAFLRKRIERNAVPAVAALRGRFEAMRVQVLAEAGDCDADRITRLLIARLLHDPSEALRRIAAEGADLDRMEELLRRLFRLDAVDGESKS